MTASPPRTFSRTQVATLTTTEFNALSPADKGAFEAAYWLTIAEPPVHLAAFVAGDYDLISSNRRFELGE